MKRVFCRLSCILIAALMTACLFCPIAAVYAEGDQEGGGEHVHDYVAVETEPTCTDEGFITHVCSLCEDSYVDGSVPALGHEWDEGVVTRDPTCRTEGVKIFTCLRCGETKKEAIDKLDADLTKIFTDVKPSDWFASAVEYVYVNCLMNGTSGTKFSPNGITNRAMVVTVLWRIEGSPKASAEASFKDLKDDWYLDAVAWGVENKIIKGYTAERFAPEEPITREQLCAILYRYSAFKKKDVSSNGSLSAFPDAGEVSDYAKNAVSWAVGLGLINGTNNSGKVVLDPAGYSTRAQVAAVLMRYAAK